MAEPTPPRLRRRTPVKRPSSVPAALPAAPLDISPLTALLGYTLRRAQIAVFDHFNNACTPLDLRPAQFSVLLLVGHNPGRKPTDIADALGIQRPNFVALLKNLEERGLLERRQAVSDHRSFNLDLTAQGAHLLARAIETVERHEAAVAGGLTAGEIDLLRTLLARITTGLTGLKTSR